MISYIPNFKNLEWSDKLSLDIAKDINNSNADMRLVVPIFGSGKSTICLGMMDTNEAWVMGQWDQCISKEKTMEHFRTQLNIPGGKCHEVVGKLRWLGLKMENGDVVEEDGFVPEETFYYDESMSLLQKRDLQPLRDRLFQKIGRDKVKSEIEAYGIEVFWKYHNDEPIIEAYREHVSDEVLSNTRIFTTTELIPMLTERNLADEIIIDEGIEGEKINFGRLKGRDMTLRKLNMSTSSTTQVKTSLLTTDKDDDIERFIDHICVEVRKFYDKVQSDRATFVYENDGELRGKIAVDLKDVCDKKRMDRLCKEWKDVKKYMTREMYEKNTISEIDDIQMSVDIIEWFYKAWKYAEVVEVRRDGHEIEEAKGVYPKYQNLIDWCTRYTGNTVTILQTVADRRLPKIYEEMFGMENNGLLQNGLDLDIIDSGMGIEKTAMVRRPFDRYSWNGGSLTKQDMETSLFRDVVMELMDELGKVCDTGVILPKNARGDDMVYTDEFDHALAGNFTIDGTNRFADVKYLFVCSQRRINPSKMHRPLIDWYLEFQKVEDISEYIRTDSNGVQVGYTDTDIDWDFDFPDDYNPLDMVWQNISVKNTVEKLFRRRNPWTTQGKTVRHGNTVKFRGNKLTSTKGDQNDFVEFLLKSLREEGMSRLEIAEHLSDLDPNSHAVNSIWETLQASTLTLPLEKKKVEGDRVTLSVNRKQVFIEKAVEMGYDSLGNTQEVKLKDVIDEIDIPSSTVHRWMDDDRIQKIFNIKKGSGPNPTTIEPTENAHLLSGKVDSDVVRQRNSENEARRDPFSG